MGTLSPTMTVREFENGYWYVDELRDFGGRIGVPGAARLRKDKLERAIEASCKFLMVAQPICGTVFTKWPGNSLANRRSMHSSRSSFTLRHHLCYLFLGFVQKGDHLLSTDGRETLQKIVDGLSSLDVVYERLDRHSGSRKHRSSPHHVARGRNNLFGHGRMVMKGHRIDQHRRQTSACIRARDQC